MQGIEGFAASEHLGGGLATTTQCLCSSSAGGCLASGLQTHGTLHPLFHREFALYVQGVRRAHPHPAYAMAAWTWIECHRLEMKLQAL